MNGLTMMNDRTTSAALKFKMVKWQELQELINKDFKDHAYVISYLDYKVLIGKAYEEKIEFYNQETFDPKFIVKMRVFNKQKELLLWRQCENMFSARMRMDGVGENIYLIEAKQVLWGNARQVKDDWVLLNEARGTEIYIPYKVKNTNSNRLTIKTRNYIDYNEMGQAGYVDCRFMDFDEVGCS